MMASPAKLTAELCARAVIAASAVAAMDPIEVMTAGPGSRRVLPRIAAAAGLQKAGASTLPAAARALSIGPNSVYNARSRARSPGGVGGFKVETARIYEAAEEAAAAAVCAALAAPREPTRTSPLFDEPQAPVMPAEPEPETVIPRPGPEHQFARPELQPPEVIAHPEIATPVMRAMPGRISAMTMPERASPRLPPVERPLCDRILELLADGSATPIGMASILGAKELLIMQNLIALQHAGAVTPGDVPPEGVRQRRWALSQRSAA